MSAGISSVIMKLGGKQVNYDCRSCDLHYQQQHYGRFTYFLSKNHEPFCHLKSVKSGPMNFHCFVFHVQEMYCFEFKGK